MVSAILYPIGTFKCVTGRTLNSRTRKHSKISLSYHTSRISSVPPNELRSFSTNLRFELWKRSSYIKNGLIVHRLSASLGNEVVIQEPDIEINQPTGDGGLDNPSEGGKSSELASSPEAESVVLETSSSTVKSKNIETNVKNELPQVPDEKLVPGATFNGRVKRIQTFGAFVDIGASIDGLVHISRLSDNFVKEVGDVVSVGQEVTVRIVEANLQARRIALTMKSGLDSNQSRQQRASDPGSTEGSGKVGRARKTAGISSTNKRQETQKSSKFHKGQILEGKVKNTNKSGAFISLPDGEEGFLPSVSNVAGDLGIKLGKTSNKGGDKGLRVGQNVSVCVSRIEKGRVVLALEGEENVDSVNMLLNPSTNAISLNAFELAFRNIPAISTVLDEKEKLQISDDSVESQEEAEDHELKEQVKEKSGIVVSAEDVALTEEEVDEKTVDKDTTQITESIKKDEGSETLETKDMLINGSAEQLDEVSTLSTEQALSNETSTKDLSEVKQVQDNEFNAMDSTSANRNDATVGSAEDVALTEEEVEKTVNKDSTQITESIKKDEGYETHETKDMLMNGSAEQLDEVSTLSTEQALTDETSTKDLSEVKQVQDSKVNAMDSTSANRNDATENSHVEVIEPLSDLRTFVPTSEVNQNDVPSNSEERAILGSGNTVSEASSSSEAVTVMRNGSSQPTTKTEDRAEESIDVGTISASLVKQLREETGAGMMDCKKALIETGGDLAKACEFLRKKGLASAEKKASRVAAEGRIGSYIHDSRIGVIIEINCETDFVSRGEIFKELVDDMAMQVAACPQVQYVSVEEIPEDTVSKEKEIELQKEDLLNKPEQIKEKIVDGRIRKILGELSLLEQPYIKNDKVIVKDWIKQSVATLGENIQVRRFVRYNLGEGLQKKSQDFAAEVAAQTAAKTSSSMTTEKHGAGAESSTLVEETKPSMEKQSVLISAALVKQLREDTGAGMMDCKKALAETGGDLEKAHEVLKKKGLASADNKSGRIAAEGRVGSYVHDSRIGVLIEMNCETDFVARGDIFKQLVEDLAMQVAACPQVQHVSIDDIPKELVDKEKEIEMQREDLLSKPENIREKIVEGRITKTLGEMALLEQPFIRDDKSLVKDVVKQAIASLGENIRVRRFVRYNLGEGIKKETKDLAAEVAAQTMLKT